MSGGNGNEACSAGGRLIAYFVVAGSTLASMLGVSVFLGLGIKGHWWLYPACYGIGLSFAAASWFLIEKPALALKQSKMRRFAAIVPVLDEVK